MDEPVNKEHPHAVFTKNQILKCHTGVEKDILSALLEDGLMYSLDEVNKTKKEFVKRKVD